jgi:hypothetical protein
MQRQNEVKIAKAFKVPPGFGLHEFAGALDSALSAEKPSSLEYLWVREIFDGYLIAHGYGVDSQSVYLRIEWSYVDGNFVFGDQWITVEETTVYTETGYFVKSRSPSIFADLKI